MSAEKNSGCDTSGWNVDGAKFQMWDIRVECRWSNSIRIPQEDTWRAPLSGLPQGEAHGTRAYHTPDDSISYPDMLSGWKRTTCHSSLDTSMVCPNALSEHLLQGRLKQNSISDFKELSSISDCFGDQKAKKTPKLTTIWVELIARVLNMLIGLKGDNYYSKSVIW